MPAAWLTLFQVRVRTAVRFWRRMLAVLSHRCPACSMWAACTWEADCSQQAAERDGQELPCLPGLQWKTLVCVWVVEQELSQQVAMVAPKVVAPPEQWPISAGVFLQRGKGCCWAQGLE